MRDLRGRGHGFPFPGDGASTIPAESDGKFYAAGFRMVRDGMTRANSGGDWSFGEFHASMSFRGEYVPDREEADCGIRLCVDWRE